MSSTPQTDETYKSVCLFISEEEAVEALDRMRETSAKLERENAALREQVRRLEQDLFITRQRRCHEIVESEKKDV